MGRQPPLHRHRAAYSLRTNMKVLSAYLLAVVGGNQSPTQADISTILESVGIKLTDEDSTQLDTLIASFEGKSVEEVMAAGYETLNKCGGGGGGSAAAAAAPAAGAAEEVKEEKKESSSSDDDMGGAGMFDEDY